MESILLVDDKSDQLANLADALREELSGATEIRTWLPSGEEDDAYAEFEKRVDDNTIFVVTDYDLTSAGQTGLFGSSIVAWCQHRAIPVGDYSRGHASRLAKEPELFEIRVPTDSSAATFVAAVYEGFSRIRQVLNSGSALLTLTSPAAVLAGILEDPELESQLAQYTVRLGTTSSALMARIIKNEEEPQEGEVQRVLTYIVGHLLLGSVLRFPGPILSKRALQALVATEDLSKEEVTALFGDATYSGPFAGLGDYHWLRGVSAVLDSLLSNEISGETSGELNKRALEAKLGRSLADDGQCPRCAGKNGGFLCPFTDRIVCERPDCSIGSNGWIPQGAALCRIEKDFFDEWSPILGL